MIRPRKNTYRLCYLTEIYRKARQHYLKKPPHHAALAEAQD
jgi:hypothetical protein